MSLSSILEALLYRLKYLPRFRFITKYPDADPEFSAVVGNLLQRDPDFLNLHTPCIELGIEDVLASFRLTAIF
jgi:hypothetical protein